MVSVTSLTVQMFVGVVVSVSAAFITWKVRQIASYFEREVERGRRNEVRSAVNRLVIHRLHSIERGLPPDEDDELAGKDASVSLEDLVDNRVEGEEVADGGD